MSPSKAAAKALGVAWLANMPTPQFVPVLNELARDQQIDLRVFYRTSSSLGRGWGPLEISHRHEFLEGHGRIRTFCRGLIVGFSRETRTAVLFGYRSSFATGLLIACRLRRARVFTQSDADQRVEQDSSRLRRKLKQLFLHLLFSRNSRVFVVSEGNAAYWREYGFPNHLPVAFESPVPDPTRSAEASLILRDCLSPQPSLKVLLFVGRISQEKGVQHLVDAFAILHAQMPHPLHCVIIGAGDRSSINIPQDVRADVHLVGAKGRDELAAYYRAADVLVVPSQREQYGLVVREALQFGLPVVAFDSVPSARELCNKAWNIVPRGDNEALAVAIARALSEERWPFKEPESVSTAYRQALVQFGGQS